MIVAAHGSEELASYRIRLTKLARQLFCLPQLRRHPVLWCPQHAVLVRFYVLVTYWQNVALGNAREKRTEVCSRAILLTPLSASPAIAEAAKAR